MNWQYFQHPTIFSNDSFTDASENWISLIKKQTGDNSFFFVRKFDRIGWREKYPELRRQFDISPFETREDVISLSKSPG